MSLIAAQNGNVGNFECNCGCHRYGSSFCNICKCYAMNIRDNKNKEIAGMIDKLFIERAGSLSRLNERINALEKLAEEMKQYQHPSKIQARLEDIENKVFHKNECKFREQIYGRVIKSLSTLSDKGLLCAQCHISDLVTDGYFKY